MPWAAAAVVGGALISADASKSASDAQTAAADKSIALNQPFHDMGVSAGNRLSTLLGLPSTDGQDNSADPTFGSANKDFSMADYQADPGYQFRLDQGNQALQNSAAARGGLLSGRAAKDAMAYNGGQASQEYANAFSRFQVNRSNKLNPLQSLMGAGQTATNGMTADVTGSGNAQAAGYVGGANAVNNAVGQGTSMYQTNRLMDNLFPKKTGYDAFGNSPMSSTLYGSSSLGD